LFKKIIVNVDKIIHHQGIPPPKEDEGILENIGKANPSSKGKRRRGRGKNESFCSLVNATEKAEKKPLTRNIYSDNLPIKS
jgi:hypothetical protein